MEKTTPTTASGTTQMSMLNPLYQHSLFAGVAIETLQHHCPTAKMRTFQHGEILYRQGGLCQEMFFVLDGQVKLARIAQDGSEFTTGLRTKGGLFGNVLEAAAPLPIQDTATIRGGALLWHTPAAEFRQLMHSTPELALRVVETLMQRERQMEQRLACFAFKHTEARLAETLRELSDGFEPRCEHGFGMHIRLTQQELADLVGASRPVVSTILNRLRKEGVLAYNREYVCVRDIDAIAHIIDS